MDFIDVLMKEHASLRAALESLELHLGPECDCGWEDRVHLDLSRFRRDLDALFRALHEHESLEETFVAGRLRRSRTPDAAAEKVLLDSHRNIDSLLNLFAAVAASIQDGRVHAARTVLSRLREELLRHMDEEERDLFPRLRERQDARAASGSSPR